MSDLRDSSIVIRKGLNKGPLVVNVMNEASSFMPDRTSTEVGMTLL